MSSPTAYIHRHRQYYINVFVCFWHSRALTFTHLADTFIQSDLQVHSGYTFLISKCVPWESNPQPFALLMQCSTTEPQEPCENLIENRLFSQCLHVGMAQKFPSYQVAYDKSSQTGRQSQPQYSHTNKHTFSNLWETRSPLPRTLWWRSRASPPPRVYRWVNEASLTGMTLLSASPWGCPSPSKLRRKENKTSILAS